MKLDLRKGYDMVNRDFVCEIMLTMGFDSSWVNRVLECITMPTFSILINGYPFHSNRDVWHVDPLFLYLFTIVMEYLLFDRSSYTQKAHYIIV